MKKSETKVTSFRGASVHSKSAVKVRRHSFIVEPSNTPRVTFDLTSTSKGVFTLPIHIPEEQVRELKSNQETSK